ncbi:hypothetical protein [Virgibacillus halodenitrificans]|uniref:hypothetical protein n=1 Tax=Virgibacillus halodenitrificans TaxID=1482 RepID=UPI000EF45C64|nr:hypothetical protein [Virgibacillus halodenitrificans]
MFKKMFLRPLPRAILVIALYSMIMFVLRLIDKFSPINAVVILIIVCVLYLGFEILLALIETGNYFVITGLLFLLFSIVTFSAGWWDKGYIDKAAIVTVATVAIFFTFLDFLAVSRFSDRFKRAFTIMFFIGMVLFNLVILMLKIPIIVEWVNSLNTDYLTAVALGLALSNIGLRQLKEKNE